MKNEKLYRIVIDGILEEIRSGQYGVGDKLPTEREVADRFGVARTTVREAMVALEMLGIIEMRRGSGVYVIRLPDDDVSTADLDIGAFELIEARRVVEGEIAALAAKYITAEQIKHLEGLLVDMEHADVQKAEAADRSFHMVVAEASGNGALVAASEFLWDLRERAPLAQMILHRARGPGYDARINEHARILASLRTGDPVKARSAMRSHLDRVLNHLLEITESDEIEAAKSRAQLRRGRLVEAD
ncbi:FadR/GntR family transcriptional regulator [Sphingomonas sp. CLY1604]|uniref:FadR/GntR family transcriptional regulator n=1 Tax=Sphingomonas sp. CLY1604 TaxID=3457786 RepID=UPI003FD7BA48